MKIIKFNEHKDIDPYGEENWEDDAKLNVDDIDNFKVNSIYTETIYNIGVDIKGYNIKFKLFTDDDGYYGYDIHDTDELPDDIIEFLDEYYGEVKNKLIEIKNNRFRRG